jgi:hypothetical protein
MNRQHDLTDNQALAIEIFYGCGDEILVTRMMIRSSRPTTLGAECALAKRAVVRHDGELAPGDCPGQCQRFQPRHPAPAAPGSCAG